MPYKDADLWMPQKPIELEPNALTAVKAAESLAIAAGPGTGKTELLSQRACYLLQTGRCPAPRRILALSFKTDAARNLKDRVALRCGLEAGDRFDSYTFHAFAKQIVDRFRLALPVQHRPNANYAIGKGKWPAFIQFPRLLTLAHAIMTGSPGILRAFQATYSHLFLDEFQDCTTAQYALVKTLLDRSQVVFTAVGDANQAIMGFAGALPLAFQTLVDDFRLEAPLELYINRRSLPYLQEVQRSILHAKEARGQVFERSGAEGGEVNLCVFSSCVQELDFLVSLVGELTQHEASRVCFIVRNRATADGLVQQLESLAIPFRDERFDVQEILSEPLADCILAWIRLGIEENPGSRQRLYQFVDNVLGLLDDDTYYTRALERSLENGLKVFREQCDVSDPSRDTLRKGIDWLLREFLGLKQIAATWSQYGQGDRLLSVIRRVGALLQEARDRTHGWLEALNLVEGVGALRIMTVHKCKGLEFDSVVVVGLEDQTFSGDNTLEEWCCFYVAASRAKSRMWFTTATVRGGNTSTFLRTQPLHRALEQAGVERTEYEAVSS